MPQATGLPSNSPMVSWSSRWWNRAAQTACLALALAWLGGCGSSDLIPVAGTVTVNGQPLASGSVTYHPDAAKGNKSQDIASGEIKDGKYEMYTGNKRGVAPGAYKVAVIGDPFGGNVPEKKATPTIPKLTLPPKFSDPKTTPLTVEVSSRPAEGAYDLKLTR